MLEIIPTILVKTFEEVEERIRKVEDYVNRVQLDIMDGVFVDNKTWNNPKDLKDFFAQGGPASGWKTKLKIEAHLMVEKPEEVIDDWLEVVDRVIVHYEACKNIKELIKKVHDKGKEIGLAINPETPIDVVRPYISNLDLILCMTVNPGWGGQEFMESVLSKIRVLREIWPDGNIEVDGGINPETAKKCIDAGANLICAGTYIFNSQKPEEAIKNLI